MVHVELLASFDGVPEEMLSDIGRVTVLSAHLDYKRLMLLQNATHGSDPIEELGKESRAKVTQRIKKAFKEFPFDRLQERVNTWLPQVDLLFDERDALAHSIAYYEVRGDGTAGHGRLRPKHGQPEPQVTPEALEDLVVRMRTANREGHMLWMEADALSKDGVAGHENILEQRRQAELASQRFEVMVANAIADQAGTG